MAQVTPLPARGDVLLDARGPERTLRVSWHAENDVVVLSVWRRDRCVATFRLPVSDVPVLIDALSAGLGRRDDTLTCLPPVPGPEHPRRRVG